MGGKTPPASAHLISRTSTITLQPVSTPASNFTGGVSAVTTTSYFTLTPTQTVTQTLIEPSKHLNSRASGFSKVYSGYGSAGWNTSLTTSLTYKTATVGTSLVKPSVRESASNSVSLPNATVTVEPISYGGSLRRMEVRQVGQIIEATIDGVAVSWTNNFDGSPQSSSIVGSTFPQITATTSSIQDATFCKLPEFDLIDIEELIIA